MMDRITLGQIAQMVNQLVEVFGDDVNIASVEVRVWDYSRLNERLDTTTLLDMQAPRSKVTIGEPGL